jgi:N-methylhydantoinase A/oxoprolinase/acetone carboxylase beta subunit
VFSSIDCVLTCSEGPIMKSAKKKSSKERKRSFMDKRTGMGLGIDAGGTYTDTVLYDFTREKVIVFAKAPTTYDDYVIGIKNSLQSLLKLIPVGEIGKIGLVALSTTLATNAIVEGKGGKVGLILIGYDTHSLRKIELWPKVVIKGRLNIEGEETEPLDSSQAEEAIKNLLKDGVEVFAVSSEVGARNPEHELKVKDLISKTTDLPVVCASELTAELNCVKRANTCFFNARLIPLVASLLSSVKKVLSEKGIDVPVMVVKGDGTLMGEEVARRNPVEMVLSGPAASVIGGAYLSHIHNGYVVDMGGTTTDVAYIKNGFVSFKNDGININGFRTAVKTVNVHTFGLGGDSYIRFDVRTKKIQIGPQRVIPISYLAHLHPDILEFFETKKQIRGEELLVQPADFFVFQKDCKGKDLHPQEGAIIQVLKEHGPMSHIELARRVNAVSVSLIRTERLEMFGNVLRAALTPTDVLHAIKAVSFWNKEAAMSAVSLYAQRAGMQVEEFIQGVLKGFYRNLLFHLFEFWFTEDGRIQGEREFSDNLASHLFFHVKDIQLNTSMNKPIVFIGAPARKYAEGVENLIGAQVIVPTFHEVANAVGAITGSIREDVTILIRPTVEGGYVAYAPGTKRYFVTLDRAKEEMVKLAEKTAVQKAKLSGALHINVNTDVKDKEVKISADDIIYLETIITASVSSVPSSKA